METGKRIIEKILWLVITYPYGMRMELKMYKKIHSRNRVRRAGKECCISLDYRIKQRVGSRNLQIAKSIVRVLIKQCCL